MESLRERLRGLKQYKGKSLSLVVLIVGLLVGVVLVGQRQIFKGKAVVDTATLAFTPTSVNPSAGSSFTVNVLMSTGGQPVVAGDIIVCFNRNLLTLTNITKPTNAIFATYAPVTSTGAFDTTRVINSANNGVTTCPQTGQSAVEFGIVAFNWGTSTLTGSFNGNMTVTALTFQAKTGTNGQTDTLRFKYVNNLTTTDSNIVFVPSVGPPEDILVAPADTSTVVVNIGGVGCTPATCFDFTGDQLVGIQDITLVANRYGAVAGSASYDSRYDLNCPQGTIDIQDITLVANRYNLSSCTR